MIDSCKRGSFIYDVVSVDFGYLCFDQHVIKLKFVQVCNFFSDLKKKKKSKNDTKQLKAVVDLSHRFEI